MSNVFLNGLKDATNFTYTENGALTHKTTKSDLLDMFALGGAFRNRSEDDVITLFHNALKENEAYAMKCLFYLRDIRGGQGERRFFRVCLRFLANAYPEIALRNLEYIPFVGRWDDVIYAFEGTRIEKEAFEFLVKQLSLDVESKTPSLLAKWLPSENASSLETKRLGNLTRTYLNMSHKQYRKTLSILRERINIVERLMSEGRWEEIEFDKIPSKAGMKYRNAFARRDILKERYKTFMTSENTTVNAKALYPYDVVHNAIEEMDGYWGADANRIDEVQRAALNKYWDNLADYIQGKVFNGMAVVDTSGSMYGRPMEVAVSLGMYCAEKAQGPYHDHFITFSARPELQRIQGKDFCAKVSNILKADWGANTNISAVFDLLLDTAIRNNCSQDEIPQNVIIISDMEFDYCVTTGPNWRDRGFDKTTLFEDIKKKWAAHGYEMPKLIFWNVDARQNNIPMKDDGNVCYVSGFSPILFEQILENLGAYDLMMNKLNDKRYENIH